MIKRTVTLYDRTFPILGESDELIDLTITSPLFAGWVKHADPNARINSVTLQSVDVIGNDTKRRALFLKFVADVVDPSGRALPGITVLRGNAVGAFIALHTERGVHVLLVKQRRTPIGMNPILEVPAGMMDGSANAITKLVEEISDETGLAIDYRQLRPLGRSIGLKFYPSPGLLDEQIFLFACDLDMSYDEMMGLHGCQHGLLEEREHTENVILPVEDLATMAVDMKTMLAYMFWKEEQRT